MAHRQRTLLKLAGLKWKLDPGEGAFYGPKIDISVYDALRRKFQCATVQLDFQLPIRFNLHYWREDQSAARPVIVHRAILGSVERMYAILTEHYAQRWPLWLSPRQIMVVPITTGAAEYAADVRRTARAAHFHCDVDARDATMQRKARSPWPALCHCGACCNGHWQCMSACNVAMRVSRFYCAVPACSPHKLRGADPRGTNFAVQLHPGRWREGARGGHGQRAHAREQGPLWRAQARRRARAAEGRARLALACKLLWRQSV
jgi:tRNA synthetase class II core domain (G, H, P, S and T)